MRISNVSHDINYKYFKTLYEKATKDIVIDDLVYKCEDMQKLIEENEKLDIEKEDYKSRCKKAIEYNYELQERYCHSAIRDELVASKIYEITEKELNILQNGSDSE
ncbi:MAG: hypothetical protein IKV94_02500 [Clostridia bacterium]|nr:hypothetical protein [Clostridia bacterium]MBR6517114.1 hypothetical protein [Bacilli bacterium]